MATIPPSQTNPEQASSSAPTTKEGSAATPPVETGGRNAAPADNSHPNSGASAPPTHPSTPKRTLTPDNVFETVANVVASGSVLVEAAVRPKISAALREKLFLAVTSVNDCRYCKWGHTHWAMVQGVSLEEINQILGHQIESLQAKNPAEAAAILFAQHYAEQLDQFDPESLENLHQYYNDAEVAEILAYVRFITLTNLTGNTVDAFFARFRSHGNTSSLFEGVVTAAAAPVALVLTQLAKFDRKVGMDKLRSAGPEPAEMATPNPDSQGDRDESRHR